MGNNKDNKSITEYWIREIQQKKSFPNLSAAEYCRRHNVVYSQFLYWQSRLRETNKNISKFIPVNVSKVSENSNTNFCHCTMEYSTGTRITIYSSEALGEFFRLIKENLK